MKLFLAPMEGVIDHHMRAILTGVGGYHQCVTEFVRVVDRLLPAHVFTRLCPELEQNCRTASGTPVTIQLLGGLPQAMAENAQQAVALGAHSIDINFGCPSRFVNRKAGGAVLLQEPQRLFDITDAVRKAVPENISVSAKIRLGYNSTELAIDNALAVQAANASYITVHARTKVDGYKHPARWEWLGQINDVLHIPMIGNGDINSLDDLRHCRTISACDQFMIGRGALTQPDLARQIMHAENSDSLTAMPWPAVKNLLADMSKRMQTNTSCQPRQVLGRLKQWLVFLKKQYPQAAILFKQLCQLNTLAQAEVLLQPHPLVA